MTNADIERMPYTLNAQQVAEILGIAKNSAYTLMHSEGFPRCTSGAGWSYPRKSCSNGWTISSNKKGFQPGLCPTGIFSEKHLKNRESYVNNGIGETQCSEARSYFVKETL